MIYEDTLRIKNLPRDLSDGEKSDFLRHFGATQVKVITSKAKQRSIAYAKFESAEVAKSVLTRLHQLTVLNSRLCVEYAETNLGDSLPILTRESLESGNKKHFKTFINRLNAFNSSVSFNQPPPSHLKYIYPKPNRATINNIAHALASVPKFYTQVLHLMNKMNLPPPFSDAPDPVPIVPRPPLVSQNPAIQKKAESSESELESDNEDGQNRKEVIPQKRALPQKKSVKRPKFNLLLKPVTNPTPKAAPEKAEDVFEMSNLQRSKKIELKVPTESLELRIEQKKVETEPLPSFGVIEATDKNFEEPMQVDSNKEPEEEQEELKKFITDDELAANRIDSNDLNVLPVFKNYHPGAPTCRLYIKNIAKSADTQDLEYIFRRYYVESNDPEKPNQFDIRLMKEGRMKGQAFVTLESVELAQKAVKETNGYILKDRPIVVAFARSAAPKK